MNSAAKWSVIVALVIGLATIASWPTGLASSWMEHFQVVGSNARYIALSKYQVLATTKEIRRLTFEEWTKYCILGQQLGFFETCPPR